MLTMLLLLCSATFPMILRIAPTMDGLWFDWATLIENKNKEIDRLNGIYKNLLAGAGVKLIEGSASFVDNHTIKVCLCLPPF